jgi:CcmD family protein
MRWNVAVLVFMALLGIGFGLTATVPVGVSAQDIEQQVQTIQGASPDVEQQAALDLAVKTLRAEQTRRVRYMFAAYVVLWAVLGVYMATLSRRQTRLLNELERLRGQVGRE